MKLFKLINVLLGVAILLVALGNNVWSKEPDYVFEIQEIEGQRSISGENVIFSPDLQTITFSGYDSKTGIWIYNKELGRKPIFTEKFGDFKKGDFQHLGDFRYSPETNTIVIIREEGEPFTPSYGMRNYTYISGTQWIEIIKENNRSRIFEASYSWVEDNGAFLISESQKFKVYELCFYNKGNNLYYALWEPTTKFMQWDKYYLILYDLQTMKETKRILFAKESGEKEIWRIIHVDEKMIILTQIKKNELFAYDYNGELKWQIKMPYKDQIKSFRVSNDNESIAISSGNKVLLIDLNNGNVMSEIGKLNKVPEFLFFTPNNKYILAISDKNFECWDLSTNSSAFKTKISGNIASFGIDKDFRTAAVIINPGVLAPENSYSKIERWDLEAFFGSFGVDVWSK